MTKLAPEWVRTSDPVIRSPARYRWTTAPACYAVINASEWTINIQCSQEYYTDRGHHQIMVNEDWDEITTGTQIMRPDWDFSPIRMRTMHHLPHIFFDTLRPERPDCPVLIPSSFSMARDRFISLDIYSYEPCGLPTGNFMPAEQAQIRLMTANPITLRACIPWARSHST